MSRESVRFATTVHLHHPGPAIDIDDATDLLHEVEALRVQLAAANERNRTLSADLARAVRGVAALDSALRKVSHTADELRFQLRLANRQDARVER